MHTAQRFRYISMVVAVVIQYGERKLALSFLSTLNTVNDHLKKLRHHLLYFAWSEHQLMNE